VADSQYVIALTDLTCSWESTCRQNVASLNDIKHALALVISGLFNDAVSISDYTVSERAWYYPSISLEGQTSTNRGECHSANGDH
jgi:hypothetical protein